MGGDYIYTISETVSDISDTIIDTVSDSCNDSWQTIKSPSCYFQILHNFWTSHHQLP